MANTPKSLFDAISESAAAAKLRGYGYEALMNIYDALTARARRNDLVVSLAYATLVALLTHAEPNHDNKPDVTRLRWGDAFETYSKQHNPASQIITLPGYGEPKLRVSLTDTGATESIKPGFSIDIGQES